jgi:hypothetical protein
MAWVSGYSLCSLLSVVILGLGYRAFIKSKTYIFFFNFIGLVLGVYYTSSISIWKRRIRINNPLNTYLIF